MRCEHCEVDFNLKKNHGPFCSAKCRKAAWQAGHSKKLATIEATLARPLAEVRALRGTHDQR